MIYCVRRSPLGLRGLKSEHCIIIALVNLSQPSWAAWIEIHMRLNFFLKMKSQPSWAAWIEIV